MRKLFLGLCLILLMCPLTTVLADGNGHLEQTYKDSYGVSAQDLTFDKNLDFSKDINVANWCYRINIPTESTVKVIVSNNYYAAILVSNNQSYPNTLFYAKPDQNGTKIISQVLYHGIYYIGFGYDGPEGSKTSPGNLRIIINPL